MMAFPGMLIHAAVEAGMSVPDDPDVDDMDSFKETHPHFWVFCVLQLGRPMQWGEQWDNAATIARIPVELLKTMDLAAFRAAGVTGV